MMAIMRISTESLRETQELPTCDNASADPLAGVLNDLRIARSKYCRSELAEPWGLEIPSRRSVSYHFISKGSATLTLANRAPILLREGDFVVLAHGSHHCLRSSPTARAVPIDGLSFAQVTDDAYVHRDPGCIQTVLICGVVEFADPMPAPLLQVLPDVLHMPRGSTDLDASVKATLDLMQIEVSAWRSGAETVVIRLAEVLMVQAVRFWLQSDDVRTGWQRALRDARICRALAAIHRESGKPWTVESLAAHVGMSRAMFSERFTALLGVSPGQYLTRWRMQVAAQWLRDGKLSLGEVASKLGYGSDAAFSRAFKRHIGVAPGAHRSAAAPLHRAR